MIKSKGKLITFEGCDGSGKTTQATLLAKRLLRDNYNIMQVKEPGSTKLSEHLRDILLNQPFGKIDPRAELMLFEAARASLVTSLIMPVMEKGSIVICDRFTDSTAAYQSECTTWEDIHYINEFATYGIKPSLTFLLDVEPVYAMPRLIGHKQDKFDQMSILEHEKVYERYLKIADENKDRVVVIKGMGRIEKIHEQIFEATMDHLRGSRYSAVVYT